MIRPDHIYHPVTRRFNGGVAVALKITSIILTDIPSDRVFFDVMSVRMIDERRAEGPVPSLNRGVTGWPNFKKQSNDRPMDTNAQ
jgi:hypothetical protein